MRTNEYDELMRIKEIQLQPLDFTNPNGDWNQKILWATQHEKTKQWYGEQVESIPMMDAVKRGALTEEEYKTVYSILAKVADVYWKIEYTPEDIEI